ncbi:MAG: hypothetical protein KDD45_13790 [Bdellovibrionales bacterium]|nr:hypothetical protein [Bdellovibrionales bacterium]
MLHLADGIFNLFVDKLVVLPNLVVFLEILLTAGDFVHFEAAEGEHIDDF